ncbi:MAG: hypothetical protein R6U70_10450 [Bacillota bacterium]
MFGLGSMQDQRGGRGRSQRIPDGIEERDSDHSLGEVAGYLLIGVGTFLLYLYGAKGSRPRDDMP